MIVGLARATEAAGWDGLSVWGSTGVSMGAAAVDPFVGLAVSDDGAPLSMSAADLAPLVTTMPAERERLGRADQPFDIAVFAFSDPGPHGIELVRGYEATGATWWLESLTRTRGGVTSLIARIEAGPPR